jgi:lysozyme
MLQGIAQDIQLAPEFANTFYGIDVSKYQGDIDWTGVKKWKSHPIHFVYIKATEGATLQDSKYHQNVNGAKDNEILIGSYHYFKTKSSPKEQFKNFSKVVDVQKQDLIPMVDVEEKKGCSDQVFHKNFKEFLRLLENHYNKKPMIYTSNSFYNKYLAGKYTDYKFFLGRYSSRTPIVRDGHTWTVWQFSEKGYIDGVSHMVDINLINPDYHLSDLLISKEKKIKKS